MIRFIRAVDRQQIGMAYFHEEFAYERLTEYARTAPDPHEIILAQESTNTGQWEITERLVISDLAHAKPSQSVDSAPRKERG